MPASDWSTARRARVLRWLSILLLATAGLLLLTATSYAALAMLDTWLTAQDRYLVAGGSAQLVIPNPPVGQSTAIATAQPVSGSSDLRSAALPERVSVAASMPTAITRQPAVALTSKPSVATPDPAHNSTSVPPAVVPQAASVSANTPASTAAQPAPTSASALAASALAASAAQPAPTLTSATSSSEPLLASALSPAAPAAAKIRIPAIGVTRTIIELPRTLDRRTGAWTRKLNRLLRPGRKDLVGHWGGSAQPGEVGNTILVGHNYGYGQNGVFVKLGRLKPGQRLDVVNEAGQTFTYRVQTVERVKWRHKDQDELLKHTSFLATGGPERLTLVTCSGATTEPFPDRIYVVAEPVR